jgi:hypothetical protein
MVHLESHLEQSLETTAGLAAHRSSSWLSLAAAGPEGPLGRHSLLCPSQAGLEPALMHPLGEAVLLYDCHGLRKRCLQIADVLSRELHGVQHWPSGWLIGDYLQS